MPSEDETGTQSQGPITDISKDHGRGQGTGFAQGSGGECRCPNCNYRESHQLGIPCYTKKCPRCGAPMTEA